MEACVSVEKEVDKVLAKFNSFNDRSTRNLKALFEDIEILQKELENQQLQESPEGLNEDRTIFLRQVSEKVKEVVSSFSAEHRDLHSSVSKIGKSVDKNFTSDFMCLGSEKFFDSPEKSASMNEVICQHFFREGLLNVAETLVKEGKLNVEEEDRTPFFELNKITASLKQKDLQPALNWVAKNKEKLREQKSSLEFKLHRLAYLSLLAEGPEKTLEAVDYAKQNLTPFVDTQERGIQNLLGCLLYVKTGLLNSPYSEMFNSCHWSDICDVFTRDACALLGLSVDSPLAICISAGCTALPILLNIKQVMQQHQVQTMWTSKEELPIEIDLGSGNRYHSIFACPILRQQATESNPPMRLICGHIISRDALNKLTAATKLKCPYCPVEQSPSDATTVYF